MFRFLRAHVPQLKLKQGKSNACNQGSQTQPVVDWGRSKEFYYYLFLLCLFGNSRYVKFIKKHFGRKIFSSPKAVLLLFSTMPRIKGPFFPSMRRAILSYSQPIRMSDLTLSMSSSDGKSVNRGLPALDVPSSHRFQRSRFLVLTNSTAGSEKENDVLQPRPQGSLSSCVWNWDPWPGPTAFQFWMALCKHNRLRPEPIRFARLDTGHAQSDAKSVNRGLPVLDVPPSHRFQRSRFLVLTNSSAASEEENDGLRPRP